MSVSCSCGSCLHHEIFVVQWLVVESDLPLPCLMGGDVCYILSMLLMLPAMLSVRFLAK